MGLPLSKVGLTDCSARIALQTFFDNYLMNTFGGGIMITTQECRERGIRVGWGEETIEFPFKNLLEYFTQCRLFTEEKRSDVVEYVVSLTRIPFDSHKFCNVPGANPKMFAYNGDDNIRILQSWAAKQANINAELRGQKVEQSKTMSSRRFITYCQNKGRSPLSQLMNIVLDNFKNPELLERWEYKTGPEDRTYITKPRIRNKLLSQGSKGEEETAETVTTGRGFQLQLDSRYLKGSEMIKLHLLYRCAFPQSYQKVSAEESLPGVLGGLSVPDARVNSAVWNGLHENHKRLIEAAMGRDPTMSYMALREINRSRRSNQAVSEESLARKTEKARAVIELWNETAISREGNDSFEIKVYSFPQANDEAIDVLETRSQKSFSSSRRLSAESIESGSSIFSRDVRQVMNQMFIPIDTLDLDLEARSLILKAQSGAEPDKIRPDPRKDFENCRSRIRRSRLASSLPPASTEPPKGKPIEWLYQVGGGKEIRQYIKRTDYMRLKPQTVISTRVLPGTLGGIVVGSLRSHVTEHRNTRHGRTYHTVKGPLPRSSPELLEEDLEDPLDELYQKRLLRARLESEASFRSARSVASIHLPVITEEEAPE